MRELPILFNTEMVRAVLDGSKTQTRRPIKPQPNWLEDPNWAFEYGHHGRAWYAWEGEYPEEGSTHFKCPFGEPGDKLWVRETWADVRGMGFDEDIYFKADCLEGSDGDEARIAYGVKYKPSIHLPKAFARIWLEVTDVRVERLQDIKARDCTAEGIRTPIANLPQMIPICFQEFQELWDSIYGKEGLDWSSNPWVFVVEFKRVK